MHELLLKTNELHGQPNISVSGKGLKQHFAQMGWWLGLRNFMAIYSLSNVTVETDNCPLIAIIKKESELVVTEDSAPNDEIA